MADHEALSRARLSIDSRARVLLCNDEQCGFALSPNPTQVNEHLRKKHSMPVEERRKVVNALKGCGTALLDPADAPPRADGAQYDDHLPFFAGFACKFCDVRTASNQTISRHVASAHEARRLELRVKPKAMFDHVHLQAWIRNPAKARYWVVKRHSDAARPVGIQGRHDHLRGVLERERHRQKNIGKGESSGQQADNPALTFTDTTPWLERTGWAETYKDVDRVLLRNLTTARLPSSLPSHGERHAAPGDTPQPHQGELDSSHGDKAKIAALLVAVDRVMDRCEYTARTTSRSLLCWLRSVKPNSCYAKPFTFVGKMASRKRYIMLLKRFVAMVFRAYCLPTDVRRGKTGIRFKKSQVQLITKIWNHPVWARLEALTLGFWGPGTAQNARDCVNDSGVLDGIHEGSTDYRRCDDDIRGSLALENDGAGTDDGGLGKDDVSDPYIADTDTDTDYGDTEDDEDDYEEGAWDDDDGGEREDNSNGRYVGNDPQVAEVLELLFGLIMNFCMEEVTNGRPASTLLVYFSGVLGFSTDCSTFLLARSYTSNLAGLIYIQRLLFLEYSLPARAYPILGILRRPRTGQLERLQPVRGKYTVLGSQSPFEELFSLLAFGKAIAGSETPPFLLRWSADGQSVSHDNTLTITMETFRYLPRLILDEAGRLCTDLMYEWKPTMDLTLVKDDLINTSSGFSFVSHPQNGLEQAFLKLSVKACTSPSQPLTTRKGTWSQAAVSAYCGKEVRLREALAVLMLMTGGGQPRGPDLLNIRVRNCGTVERGLYVYKGSMIYLTRSHKAKRSTNREFIVARFLPFEVSQILFNYLVYIRPLMDMLAREHFPRVDECSAYLFRSRTETSSQPWTTERLTGCIQRFSGHAWSQRVTLRLMRQLCIGVAEKHVREVSRPFNRFDDKTDAADRHVAFAWQSCHRPIQRARTYGLDGAFPNRLQPQLLERYEWVSTRWHEFLHLPSKVDHARRNETPDTTCKGNFRVPSPLSQPSASSGAIVSAKGESNRHSTSKRPANFDEANAKNARRRPLDPSSSPAGDYLPSLRQPDAHECMGKETRVPSPVIKPTNNIASVDVLEEQDETASYLETKYGSRQPGSAILGQPARRTERLDTTLEVQDWKITLDWLVGKCTFCAGLGFDEMHFRHTLRECERGGALQVDQNLGRLFYDVASLPWSGCELCCMPQEFCLRWGSNGDRGRVTMLRDHCKYGRHLLRDGIIGFLTCGATRYRADVWGGLAEYCGREGRILPRYDDATAVWWLTQQLVVAEVEATEMIRQLSTWTRGLRDFGSRMAGKLAD